MTAVVEDRIANPRDDAISNLIAGHRERTGEVNLPYLAVESTVLLLGGVLTSAHLSGSAMLLLLQNPEQMELVRADFSKIPRMLEEALRLESALQFMPRYTTTDTELGGVQIPAGSNVLLLFASANRDGEVFEEPEAFDAEPFERQAPSRLRPRAALLPRGAAGSPRGQARLRDALHPAGRDPARRGQRVPAHRQRLQPRA